LARKNRHNENIAHEDIDLRSEPSLQSLCLMINLAIAILNLRTGVCNNIIPYFRRTDRSKVLLPYWFQQIVGT